MHLLIDIGNSTVVLAIANNKGEIFNSWHFKTRKEETPEYYKREILVGMNVHGVNEEDITTSAITSVVPEINDAIATAVKEAIGIEPSFLSLYDAARFLTIAVEEPLQLGNDRIADAVGAAKCYGVPVVVFDFGTATTVGVIDEHKVFLGGMIIPGVKTSLTALSSRASQLTDIELYPPTSIIGRNTTESMQSGILYGTAAMVDGIISRIEKEQVKKFKVVATGGMAKEILPHCQHDIICDDMLQFKGLFHAVVEKKIIDVIE